ncbi:tRNA-aminoacylation cofactor arc1 [Magnolia sinica]|uniref:tRNA-aminoacylation cofactor arc1 n=1 Tax=Magnolia sinica TaxID=86752 RepID=UPI0026591100|nr:tRNA-aminoacylation cofactor arc1 [Magnolia sinica]
MASNDPATETILSKRNKAIISALSKRLSFDPKSLSSETVNGHDIKSLFSNILQLLGDGAHLKNKDEVMKWVEFANGFPAEAKDCHTILKGFNEGLTPKSVLLADGLKPSEADIIVFAALHSFVSCLSKSDMQKLPNVVRWMDYIQNKEDFGEVFKKISVEKTGFEPHVPKHVDKLEVDPNMKKSGQGSKNVEKVEVNLNSNKIVAEKKAAGDNKASEEKKKKPEKESVEKDTEASVSLLNIQVGVIRKAWKHPSADSLLVEEIDLGDGNLRQVVSGLAKYFTPEQLTNRHVVLVTNVKPGKLRDVMSAGLVLCASSQDHTVVEPLLPPKGAKLGERISFSGHDGKPEDVLNPKKKQLEKITPHLYTNENGVATYKGIPFMTSDGPCTSSIPSASIK